MDTVALSLPRQEKNIDLFIPEKNHVIFMASWFVVSIIALIFFSAFLYYLGHLRTFSSKNQEFKFYTALPVTQVEVTDSVEKQDARSVIVENFLKKHNAVLADYSEVFIQVADKYQLDYRLLPAISMQESNGGKRVLKGSHNPFGFGIYGSKVIKFDSWEEAIESVGKALREDYLNQGLKDPHQIMIKYTPPSLEKGGAWAKGVTQFMEELR